MKRVAILGSTGSVGLQALQVARHLQLEVIALAARASTDLLLEQIAEFRPQKVAVFEEKKALELKQKAPFTQVVSGMEGLCEVASHEQVDLVLCAMTGAVGIQPTLAAIQARKEIALANKEVLVSAGDLVMRLVKQLGVTLLPVDSEHSALFQCLEGKKKEEVKRLILTASGGAFFRSSVEDLHAIQPEQALIHPTWKMGAKVTVDSSTLMNKGLEVIEAFHLFQKPLEEIDVVIHPQSVIHSMVEMQDGSILAQMSAPSMLFPIQYAMTWPERKPGLMAPFPFETFSKLEFFVPEKGKFVCLDLAYEALKQGGSVPCYLNAANEVLVQRFLQREISWLEIGRKLEQLVLRHHKEKEMTIEGVFAVDRLARREALTA